MVITISGEYGCGSKESAQLAAEALGYRIYDSEIVTETYKSGRTYLDASTLRYYDESEGRESFDDIGDLSRLTNENPDAIKSLSLDVLPLDLRLDAAIHGALTRLAEGDNCIFLGKCANYYLRGRKNVISVFFTDTNENKTARIMKHLECDAATAQRFIKRADQRRAECYTYFTGEKWADADNYDVTINCDALGEEESAKLIKALVEIKEKTS